MTKRKPMKFYDIPATCFPCGKKVKKSRSIRCGGPCECRVGPCCRKWLTESQAERRADFDRMLKRAEHDAAKLEPWKRAFIAQVDRT